MKKILFFAICLLIAGSVSAQSYYYGPHRIVRRPPPRQVNDFYKVRFGITGGLNIANTIDALNIAITLAVHRSYCTMEIKLALTTQYHHMGNYTTPSH